MTNDWHHTENVVGRREIRQSQALPASGVQDLWGSRLAMGGNFIPRLWSLEIVWRSFFLQDLQPRYRLTLDRLQSYPGLDQPFFPLKT